MRLLNLAISILLLAVVAFGQDTSLAIVNETNSNKQVCFYDAADKLAMISFKCETVGPRSTVTTNINNVDFTMRVFEYGLKELYSYVNKKNIERITIGATSAGFRERRVKSPIEDAARYILTVCNKSRPETIEFALAFGTGVGQPHFSYGWWSVEKDKCVHFPVSTMLRADWNIPYGTKPYVYYYGKITGPQPLIWEGKGTSCMDANSVYKAKVSTLNADPAKWDALCASLGATLTKVGMRPLDSPPKGSTVFSLDF